MQPSDEALDNSGVPIMELGAPVDGFIPPPHPKGLGLSGRLVRLEPLDAGRHAADLFAANAHDRDGVNWAYLPYGPFADVADYAGWVASVAGCDDPVFFAIISRDSGTAVGVASYLRIAPRDGVIEVGHIHFSPLLQNTTMGTEAMYLMMKWAFDNGYRRYEWKCNALNRASRRAALRLGFSFEGVFRQAGIVKGRNRDTAWFAMIDREWPAISACFETYLAPENFDTDGRTKSSLSGLTRPMLHRLDTAF